MIVINAQIIWTFINIIILFVVLRIFLWKPVLNIMEQRRKTIQDQLDDAAAKDAQAGEKLAEYEQSLEGAKKESREILADARERAQAQYDQILDQAAVDAADVRNKAVEKAQEEHDMLLKGTKDQIAELALAAAAKLLNANVDDETNKKILDDFLTEAGAGE